MLFVRKIRPFNGKNKPLIDFFALHRIVHNKEGLLMPT